MDRRSWPWRKKSSERNTATVLADPENPGPVDHMSKLLDERDLSKFFLSTERKSDDTVTRWKQVEERLRILTEKLSVALSENTAKDNLVKQHSKVAEEAVCGWEKAEAEAINLKLQLDSTFQQKSAVEDRLSHVDGALKECMRQLRQVREEQEQKIHDAIVKNKREWDKVQADFEAKLVEMDHQLLRSKAENEVLSRSLQERARTISELNSAKTQAETESNIFQIRVDTAEKEKASLKYEVQVLTKELDIRNEERQYSKTETEVCNKQHLEDTKKIVKLEAECQKLRILVRRKLPGPAALAQMKVEVESLGIEMEEPFRRRASFKHPGSYGASHLEAMQQRFQNGNREIEMLTERMYAMEEESRMLREVLAQRNSELHAARLMCARTASKLSTVESHLEAVSHSELPVGRPLGADIQLNGSKDPISCKTSTLSLSDGSIHDDEASSDAWASALVSELAHFKKEKPVTNSENFLDSMKLNLMDDFSEMEHLASAIASEENNLNEETEKDKNVSSDHNGVRIKELVSSNELAQKDKEIQDANLMCMELRNKLAATEQQLSELESRNHANEAALIGLQERLDNIFEAQSDGDDMNRLLENVKAAMASSSTSSLVNITTSDSAIHNTASKDIQLRNTLKNSKSEDANGDATATTLTNAKEISDELNLEFIGNLHKVIEKLHTLTKTLGASNGGVLQPTYAEDQTCIRNPDIKTSSSAQLEILPLDNSIQKMVTLSNKLLGGQSRFEELIQEFCFFLNAVTKLPFNPSEVCQGATTKCEDPSKKSAKIDQDEVLISAVPVSKEYISDDGCQIDEASGVNLTDKDDMPPQKSLTESSEAESNRFAKLDREIINLKGEKAEIERSLEEALEKIESISTQLLSADRLVIELQDKLESCQQSKQLLEEQLSAMSASKAMIESHAKSGDALVTSLEEKIHCLEGELEEECLIRQKACAKNQELEQRLDRVGGCAEQTSINATVSEDHHQAAEMVVRSRKEKEITAAAEKLADCQRTILALGKQLKALSSPKQSPDASFRSKTESASSAEKTSHSLEPHYYHSEELQSEIDVSGGFKSSPWLRENGDQAYDQQSPWSPPGYRASSPYVSRGQLASPFHAEKRHGREADPEKQRNNEFHSPDRNEYVETGIFAPTSPPDASTTFSGGKSPGSFLAMKKRGTSNDFPKAINAARSRTPSEKGGSSAFSRLFSRTKSQLT